METTRIAIIGAGISGLACARELSQTDAKVTVFDSSRSLGGRLGTYREGAFAFDHGAQYVTTRNPSFTKYVGVAGRAGAAEPWRPRIVEDSRAWSQPIGDWHVGTPGMNAFTRPLARGLDLRTGVTVHELMQGERGWMLRTDAGREDASYAAVGVATPAPQALALLGGHGRAFRHLGKVRMSPCWSLLAAFPAPIDAGADVRRWTRGTLSWAACDSSKPQRPPGPPSWVVHASPAWSREHLEEDPRDVARVMLEEFARAIDVALPEPRFLVARRWRHARVDDPLGLPCLVDEEMAAGACGDWCIAPRVEAAFESGRALAHSLMSMLGLASPLLRR